MPPLPQVLSVFELVGDDVLEQHGVASALAIGILIIDNSKVDQTGRSGRDPPGTARHGGFVLSDRVTMTNEARGVYVAGALGIILTGLLGLSSTTVGRMLFERGFDTGVQTLEHVREAVQPRRRRGSRVDLVDEPPIECSRSSKSSVSGSRSTDGGGWRRDIDRVVQPCRPAIPPRRVRQAAADDAARRHCPVH